MFTTQRLLIRGDFSSAQSTRKPAIKTLFFNMLASYHRFSRFYSNNKEFIFK